MHAHLAAVMPFFVEDLARRASRQSHGPEARPTGDQKAVTERGTKSGLGCPHSSPEARRHTDLNASVRFARAPTKRTVPRPR